MSFKYINPGYARLTDVVNGTYNTDKALNKNQSVTGIAFAGSSTRDKEVVNIPNSKSIYCKFDVYTDDYDNGTYMYAGTNKGKFFGISYEPFNATSYYNDSIESKKYVISVPSRTRYLFYSFYFSVVFNGDNYKVEVFRDGDEKHSFTVNCDTSDMFFTCFELTPGFWYDTEGALSNIIISDEKIGLSEVIRRVPVSYVNNLNEYQSGMFEASSSNDSVIIKPSEEFASDYSEDTKVTGATIIHKSLYRDGEGLDAINYNFNGKDVGRKRISPASHRRGFCGDNLDVSIKDFPNCEFSYRFDKWR